MPFLLCRAGAINFDFEGVELGSVGVAVTTVIIGVFGGFIISLYLGNKLFTDSKNVEVVMLPITE